MSHRRWFSAMVFLALLVVGACGRSKEGAGHLAAGGSDAGVDASADPSGGRRGGSPGGETGDSGPGGAEAGGWRGPSGSGGASGGTGGEGSGGAMGGAGAGDGGATGDGASMGGKGGGQGAPTRGTPCSNDRDCGGNDPFFRCWAPGEFMGCGTCSPDGANCSSDTDCTVAMGSSLVAICDQAPSTVCYCRAVKICQAGCRARSDCPPGQGCNLSHQCQTTCGPSEDGTCPVDFSCGADGFCGRTSCTTDAGCSGACVKGACYSTPGSCDYAAS